MVPLSHDAEDNVWVKMNQMPQVTETLGKKEKVDDVEPERRKRGIEETYFRNLLTFTYKTKADGNSL